MWMEQTTYLLFWLAALGGQNALIGGRVLIWALTTTTGGGMNTSILTRWLCRFDKQLGQTRGRLALLLIDNCSGHVTTEKLPVLQHTLVQFLHKHATPILQPLDLGVIACLKKGYKRETQRSIHLIEARHTVMLYRIDLHRAALWANDI